MEGNKSRAISVFVSTFIKFHFNILPPTTGLKICVQGEGEQGESGCHFLCINKLIYLCELPDLLKVLETRAPRMSRLRSKYIDSNWHIYAARSASRITGSGQVYRGNFQSGSFQNFKL